jgi:hypothetical protein
MKFDRSLIGWIVAAVLAAVLVGVVVYDRTDDDRRPAALGGGAQGTPVPPEVAADAAKIRAGKPEREDHTIPNVPPGHERRELAQNPPRTGCDPNRPPNAFAEWENRPQSLNQARGLSDQIIVGTVRGERPGQPYTSPVEGEPGGQVSYPVQIVTIEIDEAVKGPARAGGVVTIERQGDGEGCVRVAGDPPYRAGEQHLLLLENGRGGRPPHPVSPAGRFEVGPDNALQAVEDTPVGRDIARQRLEQVLTRLRGP